MLQRKILEKIAEEFHLKPSEVELLYQSWWKEVKASIESNDLTKYKDCKYTDINIPMFGKLVLDTRKVDIINERVSNKRNSAS